MADKNYRGFWINKVKKVLSKTELINCPYCGRSKHTKMNYSGVKDFQCLGCRKRFKMDVNKQIVNKCRIYGCNNEKSPYGNKCSMHSQCASHKDMLVLKKEIHIRRKERLKNVGRGELIA